MIAAAKTVRAHVCHVPLLGAAAVVTVLLSPAGATAVLAQSDGIIPGPNVNMVSGTTWPDGDPFLQRQNEPSLAVSTRNPLHLLAGANDYRTVDLPGLPDGKETGDSWLGVFESTDGGGSWKSTLIPCYPQDAPDLCMSSPLFGYEAAADPVVRAGTHGLFYYSGIVFNRGIPAPSVAFVARFMDLNNDTADPIQHIDTVLVDSDPGGEFIDKTWLEVDIPRNGAQTVTLDVPQGGGTVSQQVQCGNVYMAWAAITGEGATLRTNIMFSRSTDCGGTWSAPIPLSGENTVSQGATIAVAPDTGKVHVAWRQFETPPSCTYPRLWWVANLEFWPVQEITVGGVTYDQAAARELLRFLPISTPHTVARQLAAAKLNVVRGADDTVIRDTIQAADGWLVQNPIGSRPRRTARRDGLQIASALYAFNWGQTGPGSCFDSGLASEDAIMTCASTDGGQSFSPPTIVAELSPFDQGTSELSFRTNAYPTMAVDETGRAYLAWSTRGLAIPNDDAASGDSRIVIATSADGATWTTPQPIDQPGVAGHQIFPSLTYNAGKLVMVYDDFRADASEIFEPYVVDLPVRPLRHTVDVRSAIADPGIAPEFTDYSILAASRQVSRYPFVVTGSGEGDAASQQLQWNPPNLPMFALGTKPFFADYLDVAGAPRFVSNGDGTWSYNTAPSTAPVFHAAWTDNRDVVGPPDGDWTSYIPPGDGGTSVFDGTSPVPACGSDTDFDRTQMRNQNVYTSRLTSGLFVAVPSNSRPLTTEFPRSFVLFVQNATGLEKTYRLAILNQPAGGSASFLESATSQDVTIAPYSSTSEVVFVQSSDEAASVDVRVRETGPCEVDGNCLESTVTINPDSSNPPPADPALAAEEYYNPAVLNPAVHNPAVYNPAVLNEAVYNPAVFNLDPLNPAVLNYNAENPAVYNPAVLNPAVYNSALIDDAFNLAMMTLALTNPAVFNPAVLNPAVLNPAVLNPAVLNPAVLNPAVLNPAVFNPAVLNPAVLNPAVLNPAVLNPAVLNSTITDAHFVARNNGNVPMAYSFNVRLRDQPEGLLYQLIIYRLYFTPVANGCELTEAAHHELLVNDLDPNVFANLLDPDDGSPFYLDPDESAVATLRIFPDPNAEQPGNPADFNVGGLSVSVVSKAPNPGGGGGGYDQEPFDQILGSDIAPLEIATSTLPDGVVGSPYTPVTLSATGGAGVRSWSVAPGSVLPPGLLLSVSGVLSGTPTGSGSFSVTVRVTDETQLAERALTVEITSTAALLRFAYQGTVDRTDGYASGGAPNSAPYDAFLGETIRVEYTFDPTTADTNPSGNGDYPGAVKTLTVAVGPHVYTATSGTIIVANHPPGPDQYIVDVPVGLSGPPVGGVPVARIEIILTDPTATYFSSDAMPTTPPDPTGFGGSSAIQLQFWDPADPDPIPAYGIIQANTVAVTGGGLTFVTQPANNTPVNTSLGNVQVRLTDATDAILPGFSVFIALVPDGNPGTLVPPNPESVTGAIGVADFPGLQVTALGTGYRLVATAGGVAALSDTFDIVVPIVANTNDTELTETGAVLVTPRPTIRVGARSAPPMGHNGVVNFQLPDLGPVDNPFTSAKLVVNLDSVTDVDGFTFNVDVYAFPPSPGAAFPSVGTHVYYESQPPDPNSDMTLLQDDFIVGGNLATAGLHSTSTAGSARLLDYLNQQYAGGAGIGEYVFLRFNPDADNGAVDEGYNLTSANGAIKPTIFFTTGP